MQTSLKADMDSPHKSPKDIVESEEFEKHKQQILPDARRFDEVIESVAFTAASNPGLFPLIPSTKIRVAKTQKTPDTQPLTIYFVEHENKITFLDVEITQEENGI